MHLVDGTYMMGRGWLDRSRTWAIQTKDGGQRYSPMLFVTEYCGREIGFPRLAVDRSAASTRDRVYVGCAPTNKTEIAVIHSTKGVDEWSDPVRVAGGTDTLMRRTTAIAVNDSGVVAVGWYEKVAGAAPDCHRVMVAGSVDGGETFTRPVPLSPVNSCVNTPKNGWSATRWAMGGDYFGFAAAPDGTFRAVWADSRSGVYQLRFATIEARRDGTVNKAVSR